MSASAAMKMAGSASPGAGAGSGDPGTPASPTAPSPQSPSTVRVKLRELQRANEDLGQENDDLRAEIARLREASPPRGLHSTPRQRSMPALPGSAGLVRGTPMRFGPPMPPMGGSYVATPTYPQMMSPMVPLPMAAAPIPVSPPLVRGMPTLPGGGRVTVRTMSPGSRSASPGPGTAVVRTYSDPILEPRVRPPSEAQPPRDVSPAPQTTPLQRGATPIVPSPLPSPYIVRSSTVETPRPYTRSPFDTLGRSTSDTLLQQPWLSPFPGYSVPYPGTYLPRSLSPMPVPFDALPRSLSPMPVPSMGFAYPTVPGATIRGRSVERAPERAPRTEEEKKADEERLAASLAELDGHRLAWARDSAELVERRVMRARDVEDEKKELDAQAAAAEAEAERLAAERAELEGTALRMQERQHELQKLQREAEAEARRNEQEKLALENEAQQLAQRKQQVEDGAREAERNQQQAVAEQARVDAAGRNLEARKKSLAGLQGRSEAERAAVERDRAALEQELSTVEAQRKELEEKQARSRAAVNALSTERKEVDAAGRDVAARKKSLAQKQAGTQAEAAKVAAERSAVDAQQRDLQARQESMRMLALHTEQEAQRVAQRKASLAADLDRADGDDTLDAEQFRAPADRTPASQLGARTPSERTPLFSPTARTPLSGRFAPGSPMGMQQLAMAPPGVVFERSNTGASFVSGGSWRGRMDSSASELNVRLSAARARTNKGDTFVKVGAAPGTDATHRTGEESPDSADLSPASRQARAEQRQRGLAFSPSAVPFGQRVIQPGRRTVVRAPGRAQTQRPDGSLDGRNPRRASTVNFNTGLNVTTPIASREQLALAELRSRFLSNASSALSPASAFGGPMGAQRFRLNTGASSAFSTPRNTDGGMSIGGVFGDAFNFDFGDHGPLQRAAFQRGMDRANTGAALFASPDGRPRGVSMGVIRQRADTADVHMSVQRAAEEQRIYRLSSADGLLHPVSPVSPGMGIEQDYQDMNMLDAVAFPEPSTAPRAPTRAGTMPGVPPAVIMPPRVRALTGPGPMAVGRRL